MGIMASAQKLREKLSFVIAHVLRLAPLPTPPPHKCIELKKIVNDPPLPGVTSEEKVSHQHLS